MFFPSHNATTSNYHKGFTLVELITVIAILAIIATAAISSYDDGVKDSARNDVTQFEMAEIRKALLQFRKDSGTRNFPGQGIYNCIDVANATNINPNIDAQLPINPALTDADKIAWCEHPANLWMLFQDPLGTGWNVDTKRGWNGPYLQRKDGFLTLNQNTVNLNDIAVDVWAVSDPYIVNQQSSGVNWSLEAGGDVLDAMGAPYVLLVDIVNSPAVYQPRLISAGDDGEFELNNGDPCTTPLNANSQALDQVLCLLN